MPNEVIITAAGWGKTTHLAERARAHVAGKVALVTYTTNNVQEIRNKLFALDRALPANAEVWSWYRFLLHEMARPYQRAILNRRIEGLFWAESRSVPYVPRHEPGSFFMTAAGEMYSDKIARFVLECNDATGGKVIARLAERFSAIFVDEVQDMAGYDLDLLEIILRSNIDVVVVGDHRQATYRTNNAARNAAYAGQKIVAKFKEWEKAGLVTLRHAQETLRCHQLIADLADTFYLQEPRTISKNASVTGHDGVFLIESKTVPEYVARYKPQVLRLDRKTQCEGHFAMNFGEVKGMTFDRVLIFPHKKGRQWLASGDYAHVVGVAAKMYVGITRARQSVAFVFDEACNVPMLVRQQST